MYTAQPAQKSNRLLLTCGILFAAFACLGVLALGLLALSGVFNPPEASSLTLALKAPAPVAAGSRFEVGVRITNPGRSSVRVTRISLPGALLAAAEVTGSRPAYTAFAPNGSQTVYQYDLSIAPGKTIEVDFALKALQAGDFSGTLTVSGGAASTDADLRVVITEPTAAVALKATAVPPAPTLAPTALSTIPYHAVVQILAEVEVDGKTTIGWSGSGTIISPDGLILTNAHVVLSDRYYTVKNLIVAITTAQDAPPEQRYLMKLLQADQKLDIAVGRIATDLQGNPVDPASLNLPTAMIGNSDELNLGDPLTIIGYPGIGGETVTLTRGDVSGFTAEADYGNRAFIKTSATISGGNSGGLASNAKGELIGIPSQLGYGGDGQFIDCRVLADTNRDGVIDNQDSCVPTGGFINALRPIKLAIALIEAAKGGEVNIVSGSSGTTPQQPAPSGSKVLYQDDFSDPGSGWEVISDSDSAVGYANGAYQVSVFQPKYLTWSYLEPAYDDTVLRVDAKVTKATRAGDYGLICRRQDAENFYGFEVSEDGYFVIYKYVAGEYTALHDWEASDAIPSGKTVQLTVSCVGDQLSLAVGGTVLAAVTDSSFSSGNVGLIAGTMDTPGLTVAFDNFAILKP